jgi:hypothetical protein
MKNCITLYTKDFSTKKDFYIEKKKFLTLGYRTIFLEHHSVTLCKYDEIISLGSQCNPGLSLRKLNLKKETYPFDWVRSNSKIIYDILVNGCENYLDFGEETTGEYFVKDIECIDFKDFPISHINRYGQYFTHYEIIEKHELYLKFKKYFNRFFELLSSNKTVLFIHCHEEYIYNKKSRDNSELFYDYLCKINDVLEQKYPNLNFEIINIDINNNYKNYKNIKNLSIKYEFRFSDYGETHYKTFFNPYRNAVTAAIKDYLKK